MPYNSGDIYQRVMRDFRTRQQLSTRFLAREIYQRVMRDFRTRQQLSEAS